MASSLKSLKTPSDRDRENSYTGRGMKSASQGQGAPRGDHLEISHQQIKMFKFICGSFEQGQGFHTNNSTRNNFKGLRGNIIKTSKEKKKEGSFKSQGQKTKN